jgi:hypothetical protein
VVARIIATTIDDWQEMLSMARSRGWRYEYEEQGRVVRMPVEADDILRRAATAFPVVRMWPARDLLAIFRPARVDEIEFDVDLRELQGQQQLDELCAFLRAIGRRLNKPVLMYPEGGADQADIGYSPELGRVVKLRRG